MSFAFPSWETAFSPAFYESAKGTLETALNKGNKPPVIQGRIEVVELSMGTQPPTLTLLEIGDLSLDRFRGILRLGYQGDAWLEVRCRVQANPLSHNPNLLPSSTLPLSTPLLASQPLLVPMTLRLSKLHLRAILILVVSASKGITLVFKNDPLQNVDVSSTFDSVEVIRGYLQQEIEGQLREMFREDLPGIIHRLSQRWFTGSGVGGKVEMPYMDGPGITTLGKPEEDEDDLRASDPYAEKPIFPPYQPTPSLSQLTPKRRALAQHAARTRRLSTALSESPSAYTTLPGIEDYDPTYGLRPEGVPTHSGYEAFGRLWEKAREGGNGLGSLMRLPVGTHDGEVSDQEEDEDVFGLHGENDSVEAVEAHEVLGALSPGLGRPGGLSRRNSARSRVSTRAEDTVEWESYPAVGGGVITRPRVYHAQSQIRAPSEVGGGAIPSPSATGAGTSITARASSVGGASSTVGSLRRQNTGLRTPGGLPIAQPQYRPASSAVAGPGPSSLRRMVTSRSDVFLSRSAAPQDARIPASASYASLSQPDRQTRRQSGIPPKADPAMSNYTSPPTGSSWSNTDPTRSSYSTLPSSTSLMSIPSPPRTHLRTPSLSTSPLSPSSFPPRHSIIGPGGITLPMNNSVSQLAALSNSAHTLSPYARGHEHIAVRSFPHLGRGGSSAGIGGGRSEIGGNGGQVQVQAITGDGRVKGTRKRVFKLGGNGKGKEEAVENQGEVDDFMPLGAISPHLADSRQLSPITQSRSLYPFDKISQMGYTNQPPAPPIPQDRQRKYRPTSLTGIASAMMSPPAPSQRGLGGMTASASLSGLAALGNGQGLGGLRPNLLRSPDSRSSYGFPTRSSRR